MIAIRANIHIKRSDRVRFLAALQDFIPAVRKEPGCLFFVVSEDTREANRFYVIGEFEAQTALDAHEDAAHTGAFRSLITPLIASREPTLVFTISKVEPLGRQSS